ncbi:MAG: KEOPS complex kinase/ATPase Bud32 [Nanoarchaeota archaeon]
MKQRILYQGAEAFIIKEENRIIKKRIKKSYRIPDIDEKLRARRTRSEAKIIEKLQEKINVPKILKVDEKNKEIFMQYIEGKKLSEFLDKLEDKNKIMEQVGEEASKLHDSGIIHGDLTTSNMILHQEKVYIIDFGLSFHSSRIEDKAVDLHLLRQALEAKHFLHWKNLFNSFLKGYKSRDREKILKQLKKVEARGRYKG